MRSIRSVWRSEPPPVKPATSPQEKLANDLKTLETRGVSLHLKEGAGPADKAIAMTRLLEGEQVSLQCQSPDNCSSLAVFPATRYDFTLLKSLLAPESSDLRPEHAEALQMVRDLQANGVKITLGGTPPGFPAPIVIHLLELNGPREHHKVVAQCASGEAFPLDADRWWSGFIFTEKFHCEPFAGLKKLHQSLQWVKAREGNASASSSPSSGDPARLEAIPIPTKAFTA